VRSPTAEAFLLVAALFAASGARAQDDAMHDRVAPCATCHGESGRSHAEKYFPSIAGKPAGYLQQQMQNFRDGRRRHTIMQRMFAYLSDDYLGAMARYYAAQSFVVAEPRDIAPPETLELGRNIVERGDTARDVPACKACHGESLTGAQPSIPGLVGLPADYLQAQLGAWRSGVRKARDPDCMAQIATKLTDAELVAATAWIASRPTAASYRPADRAPAELPMRCGGVQ
jgi:cytochrome c553